MPRLSDKELLSKYPPDALNLIAEDLNHFFELKEGEDEDFIDTNKHPIMVLMKIKHTIVGTTELDVPDLSKHTLAFLSDLGFKPIPADNNTHIDAINEIIVQRLAELKNPQLKKANDVMPPKPVTTTKTTTKKSTTKKSTTKKSAPVPAPIAEPQTSTAKKSAPKTNRFGVLTRDRQKEPRRRGSYTGMDAFNDAVMKLCKRKKGATRREITELLTELYNKKNMESGQRIRKMESFSYLPSYICNSLLFFGVLEVVGGEGESNSLILHESYR